MKILLICTFFKETSYRFVFVLSCFSLIVILTSCVQMPPDPPEPGVKRMLIDVKECRIVKATKQDGSPLEWDEQSPVKSLTGGYVVVGFPPDHSHGGSHEALGHEHPSDECDFSTLPDAGHRCCNGPYCSHSFCPPH